jgi:S1-C subfamily serine protease
MVFQIKTRSMTQNINPRTTRKVHVSRWGLRAMTFYVQAFIALTLFITSECALGQACTDIANQSRLSVVHIQAEMTSKATGAVTVRGGTGFVVSTSGLVITNKHVIAPTADSEPGVKITASVGSQQGAYSPMHWLANSDVSDIAILQFNDTSRTWTPIVIGNPWLIDVGHPLCSMSFPLDVEFVLARGAVTGKGAPYGWWYSDMPSNPGDSGAPVFSAIDGKVVALKVGDRDDAKGLSYIIPINLATPLLESYAGLQVPVEHDRRDGAVATQYTNNTIECKLSSHPFARGYCSVTQCPNGQWVRGSATLLSSGDVIVKQGLETDRLDLGICGWVQFRLISSSGAVLGYGYNQRRCIGAKRLGRARIEDLPPDHVKVPAPIANKVSSIELSSFCAGERLAPLGFGGDSGPANGTVSLIIGEPTK